MEQSREETPDNNKKGPSGSSSEATTRRLNEYEERNLQQGIYHAQLDGNKINSLRYREEREFFAKASNYYSTMIKTQKKTNEQGMVDRWLAGTKIKDIFKEDISDFATNFRKFFSMSERKIEAEAKRFAYLEEKQKYQKLKDSEIAEIVRFQKKQNEQTKKNQEIEKQNKERISEALSGENQRNQDQNASTVAEKVKPLNIKHDESNESESNEEHGNILKKFIELYKVIPGFGELLKLAIETPPEEENTSLDTMKPIQRLPLFTADTDESNMEGIAEGVEETNLKLEPVENASIKQVEPGSIYTHDIRLVKLVEEMIGLKKKEQSE